MNFFEKKTKEGGSPVNFLFKSSGWSQCGLIPHYSKVRFFRTIFLTKQFICLINSFYIFLKIFIYLNSFKSFNLKKKTLTLDFLKNDFSKKNNLVLFNSTFTRFNVFITNNKIKKLLYLISTIFYLNKNILFVDYDINYNYLPINNTLIFDRSFNRLSKVIKYFNISAIFYLNLKKKKFIFKKLHNCNLINISLSDELVSKKFDLNFPLTNNNLYVYLLYLYILKMYLKIKNNL